MAALAALSIVTGTMFVAGTALAVHDEGIFQLDGNPSTAVQSTPPAVEDWDLICKAHLPTATPPGECIVNPNYTLPGGTTAARPSAFIADAFAAGIDDVFTTGGSKDDLDISSWKFKNAQPSPDKDDLEHAFAAEYICTTAVGCADNNGDKFIYFGADRFTNEGDANIAFWFLQGDVAEAGNGATPDLCTSGGGCGFSGVHVAHGAGLDGYICYPGQTGAAIIAGGATPAPNCTGSTSGPGADDTRGDVLIVSAFTNGGVQPNIAVYEWVGLGKAPNALKINADRSLVAIPIPGQTQGCAPLTTEDPACAIVNPGGEATPWTFSEKADGATNEYQASELYEGGLNLSALGLAETCFSTFVVNTRSSASVDATLKDFALGDLGRCGATIVTTPVQSDGTTAIPAAGLSIGTGSVAVKDSAALTVTGITNWSGTLTFFICKVDSPGTCDGTTNVGTQMGTTLNVNQATPSPILSALTTVTSVGRYCWRAFFDSATLGVPDQTDSASTECFTVNPVTPSLVTQASATVALGQPISDTATIGATVSTATQPTNPPFNTTGAVGAAAGGDITWTAYGPDSCLVAAKVFGPTSITISGNGTYGGTAIDAYPGTIQFTPSLSGTYEWVASYSGNGPNTNPVAATTCPFPDGSETVIVNNSSIATTPHTPADPTDPTDLPDPITTALSIGTGSVQVQDKATVTGTGNAADPTGNVKFFLCGPIAVATDNCATGGTQVGSPVGGEALIGGTAGDSTSTVFSDVVTVTSAGRYCFRAEYLGDSKYPASKDPKSITDTSLVECFTINPVTPSLETQASAAVSLGQPISDTGTIAGTARQPVGTPPFNTTGAVGALAGGTISFTAYGPDSCTTIAYGPVTVTISGNGTYGGTTADDLTIPGTAQFTPTAAGQYVWVASYSGNSPNTNPVAALACSVQPAAEKVIVTQTQISTSPSVYPNDSATITVANGAAPTGNVVFSLYDTAANCANGLAAGRLYTQTVALPAGALLSKTVSTSNGDGGADDYAHTNLAATTLYWRVTYAGDANHQGRNSLCLESTAIDHTADSSGGTAP